MDKETLSKMMAAPSDSLTVDLAKFEAERARAEQATVEAQKKIEQIEADNRQRRREFWGAVLIGIALVGIALAVVGALWHAAVSGNWARERIERERTDQVRACIASLEDPTERQLCVALLGSEAERDS